MFAVEIPSGIYGYGLLRYISQCLQDDPDSELLQLLERLCSAMFVRQEGGAGTVCMEELRLTAPEHGCILTERLHECDNTEVKARCMDALCRYGAGDILCAKQAIKCYADLYAATGNQDCLLRASELFLMKNVGEPELSDMILRTIIDRKLHPAWIDGVLKNLVRAGKFVVMRSSYKELSDFLAKEAEKMDFSWNEKYLLFLRNRGEIGRDVYLYRMAILNEKEGDSVFADRKPGTFYPTAYFHFDKAFRCIMGLSGYEEDKGRIRVKYEESRRHNAAMLKSAGLKVPAYKGSRMINDCVIPALLDMIDPEIGPDNLGLFLHIPFISSYDCIKDLAGRSASKSYALRYFSPVVTVDGEYNRIGKCSGEDWVRIFYHRCARKDISNAMMALHREFVEKGIAADDAVWSGMLDISRPVFASDNCKYGFARGLSLFYGGDLYSAAFVLMPHFEHLLRSLYEHKVGDVTKLTGDIQKEPVLGEVLKGLKEFMGDGLYFELQHFLNDPSDTNLRNAMMHGLASKALVEENCRYLVYLCLNLWFCGEDFLCNGNRMTELIFKILSKELGAKSES